MFNMFGNLSLINYSNLRSLPLEKTAMKWLRESQPRGQSYEANFWHQLHQKRTQQDKFHLELHQFWCNLCQQSFYKIDPWSIYIE